MRSCFSCRVQWPCNQAIEDAFPGDGLRQARFREAAERFHHRRSIERGVTVSDPNGYTNQQTESVEFPDGRSVTVFSRRRAQQTMDDPAIGRATVVALN
jgi:hypothetical protein